MRESLLPAVLAAVFIVCLQESVGQFSITPSPLYTINATDDISIECSHLNATNIFWEKDGTPIMANTNGFTNRFSVATEAEGMSNLSIISADFETHNGSYSCVAVLEDGTENTSVFHILVQFIGIVTVRQIIDPCADGVIYVDSNVTLECSVSDSQPAIVSRTWFLMRDSTSHQIRELEENNLNNNNLYLNIVGIRSTDAGEYFCSVSNGELTKDSNVVRVTVNTSPPSRELQLVPPRDTLTAKKGEMTVINCLITPPSPSFMPSNVIWTKDNQPISSGNGVILFSSSCNFTLLISSTNSSNVGTYKCTLDGAMSPRITLVLASIPATYRVKVTPPTTTLGVKRNISFECIEAPPMQTHNVDEEITWLFVSSRLGTTVDLVDDGERVQIGTRTLTINSLRLEDSGRFICVANHPLVDPIYTSVNLTVEDSLPVTIAPAAPVVRLGLPITLTCTIQSSRSATFLWLFNNAPLSSSNRFSITSSSSSMVSTLVITSVLEEDLGTFSCVAMDSLHIPLKASATVIETNDLYLFGNRTQEILKIRDGDTLHLQCPVRGRSSSASLRWFMGSVELQNNMNGVSVMTLPNGTSVVEGGVVRLGPDDGDKYKCAVTDGRIKIELSITLYVTIGGNITKFPPPISNATEGAYFQLDCLVSGRPVPRVNWLKGITEIPALNDPTITNYSNGSLIFESVRKEHEGTYICFIKDPAITHSTNLRVGKGESGSSLNGPEAILIYTVSGVVGVFLIIVCPLLIFIGCCFWLRLISEQNTKRQDSPTGPFHMQASLRKDNSGILMDSSAVPIFYTLRSPDIQYSNEYQTQDPPNSVAMTSFNHGGSVSLFTESHTSSPMHGSVLTPVHDVPSPLHRTIASTSIFSTEEHNISENGLPNFPRNNVKLGDFMGQGEFGPVLKAVAKNIVPGQSETEVAVKLLVSETVEDTGFQADLTVVDYANQMKLEYKNVASILAICSDKEPYYVIYEYLDKGDLKNFLLDSCPEAGVPPTLTDYELTMIIMQVANGMAYLFSQRIIHGDIATRNCLVSSKLQVKIGDLGIGHELYAGDYYDNGAQLLPIRWMPPELLTESEEGPSFSLHSDVWSFGVFCWEVMSYAKLPYGNYSDEEVLSLIPAGSRLRSPSQDCPEPLYLVMMDCWNEEPERRPEFDKILAALASINID